MHIYVIKRTTKLNGNSDSSSIRNLHYIVVGKTSRNASARIKREQREELKEAIKSNHHISYEVVRTIKRGLLEGPLPFLVAGILN